MVKGKIIHLYFPQHDLYDSHSCEKFMWEMSEDRNLNIGIKLARKLRTIMGLPKFSSSIPIPRKATRHLSYRQPSSTIQSALLHWAACFHYTQLSGLWAAPADCFSTAIFLSISLSRVLSILQWPPSVSSSSSQLHKIPILQSHHCQDKPSIPFNCVLYWIKWFFSKLELCSSTACTPAAPSNMCTAILHVPPSTGLPEFWPWHQKRG